MEWDQIAHNWTVMTERLRGDCAARPHGIGAAPEAGRGPSAVDRQASETTMPDAFSNERRPTSFR